MSDRRENKRRQLRRSRALEKGGVVLNAIRVIFGGKITSDPNAPVSPLAARWLQRKQRGK